MNSSACEFNVNSCLQNLNMAPSIAVLSNLECALFCTGPNGGYRARPRTSEGRRPKVLTTEGDNSNTEMSESSRKGPLRLQSPASPSMGSLRAKPLLASPGPATYHPEYPRKRPPSCVFRTSTNMPSLLSSPGPLASSPKVEMSRVMGGCATFGKSKRHLVGGGGAKENLPGPGNYETEAPCMNNHSFAVNVSALACAYRLVVVRNQQAHGCVERGNAGACELHAELQRSADVCVYYEVRRGARDRA